jgi:hypothetical protein
MTAIEKYTRLEALGQWKESPDHTAREVVVSFENATLVLSDVKEKPLCHWAMAATFRISLDGSNAVYTPDTEGFETLEINDAQMVDAIAQVSSAAVTEKPRTHWLRWVFLLLILGTLVTVTVATPALMRSQAVRMTGPESARKLGADMISSLSVKTCREPRADTARALFLSRAFPGGRTILLIATDQPHVGVFPGGIVLIGGQILQQLHSPEDLADLVTALKDEGNDKVEQLFETSSIKELFVYITSGKLSETRINTVAQNIISAADNGTSIQIKSGQYTHPILRDQDWVALQGICLE